MIASILIGISLSLDCFAISISQGIKNSKDRLKGILTLAFLFTLFQCGMLVIGYFSGNFLSESFEAITKWISFLLLLWIGIRMVRESFEEEEEEDLPDNTKEYLLLSITTSIDALAAGFALPQLQLDWKLTTIFVGLICLLFTLTGGFVGKKIGEKFGKKSEIVGGVILIGLGIKILL
ncbi:MAG TPA: manganese efflux pump MntP family protein [Leptospiraceae bacterium]|nr:manganese efflux pump MntP family protein [Leptospiraceae bacterium]HMX31588.1 manganese efflux pump MntP family protein [Leptospiraceae bacterium]HMY29625.1 manganese efflux pump MntP family protein [Leptospiraceae bacterium]HMZ62885.1 manganese efflux pump MntP family protein [Leptospiraceae bacterium]HNA05936.1 manganese efflux pump MntP family protein [Leptospiraceae bacterium]